MQLGRPQDTMSAHMFTFLNQRYGLKQICIEQAKMILKALQQFMSEDSDVTLFAKILDHKVDEQFWYVQQHVKSTVLTLYKAYIREKYQRILT
jgi:hypothetical protein